VEHYRSYRQYVRQRFGRPVLTIPLNAGFSCPNRDGVKSSGGCSFCDNRSFSPVWDETSPVTTQLTRAIEGVKNKFGAFIVYLQPYSNTYGSVERLSSIYEPLISHPGVVGLAIGTRPDCFSDAIYDYLHDVSGRTYLSVEIGLQSAHDETLAFHRRGHSLEDFRQCVRILSGRGISTVAHVMLGLPNETEGMMLATAQELARLPVAGVKIHQLMVIRGTLLHDWFTKEAFECLSIERYAALLAGFLSFLRPDQCIHRIAASARSETGLVAPLWSADKAGTVQYLKDYLDRHGIHQGMRWMENG
jgi:uncharacterized protein